MGNLVENNAWPDGVRHFEANAVLTGGPDCPDNLPIQDLADRSRFQRSRNVTPWSAVIAYPIGAYVQDGGTTWKSIAVSTNVLPDSDATKWVRWGHTAAELTAALNDTVAAHEAKADPHPTYWNDARGNAQVSTAVTAHEAKPDPHLAYWNDVRGNAKIATAVAALVNSSPAALDTLAELAAALGGDANFAATVTNALASKAPLASPAFTGNPTAPTQPAFDNSTKLVTSAFVKRQGIQASGFNVLVGATTLDSAHVGGVVYLGGAGNYTVTLPLASTLPPGARIEFISGVGVSPVTIQRQGADQLAMNANVSATSLKMALGDTLVLETDGVKWFAAGGSSPLAYTGGFAASLASNGYQKLPSGLIIQWGRVTSTAAMQGVTWTFPIAFPNALLSYFAMTENSSGQSYYSNIGPLPTAGGVTGAVVTSTYPGTAASSCLAIGY